MTKEEIATTLKQCRIDAGFEAKEVAEKLISIGAIKSIKSFYNWESGRTQPDADTFMYLCDLYEVKDIMQTFGFKGTKKAPVLTEAETEANAEAIYNSLYKMLIDLGIIKEGQDITEKQLITLEIIGKLIANSF